MVQRQRGELESDVMNAIWDCPDGITSGELRATFDEPIPALTTIVTVLERLRDKGRLTRTKRDGRGYIYAAAAAREESLAETMSRSLNDTNNRALLLMNFAGNLNDEDRAVLRDALREN